MYSWRTNTNNNDATTNTTIIIIIIAFLYLLSLSARRQCHIAASWYCCSSAASRALYDKSSISHLGASFPLCIRVRARAKGWEHNDGDKERHLIYFDTIVYLTVRSRSQNENENRDHQHHTIWWSIVGDNDDSERRKSERKKREKKKKKTHLDARARVRPFARAWVITNRLLWPVWIPQELIVSITETMKMIEIHRA